MAMLQSDTQHATLPTSGDGFGAHAARDDVHLGTQHRVLAPPPLRRRGVLVTNPRGNECENKNLTFIFFVWKL
jgi:hypothetical protein